MSRRDRSLRAVAAALADGESVDWASAAARLSAWPDRAVLDNLRTLADIADVTSGTRESAVALGRGGLHLLPAWAIAVLALAVAQVAVGLAGWVVGTPENGQVPSIYLGVTTLAFAASGGFLLAVSRTDERAANLGALFLCVASASAHPLSAWLLPLLPAEVRSSFAWRGLLAEAFIPLFLFLFLRSFPRVVRLGSQETVLRMGIRVAAGTSLVVFVANLAAAMRRPGEPASDALFGWWARQHPAGTYWVLIVACCAGGLLLALLRARDAAPPERRRAAVFLTGLVVGLMPFALIVLLDYLVPPFHGLMLLPEGKRALAAIAYTFVLSVPLTTVYAVRSHRVMGVGRIVHRSLQYAIARTTLRTIAVAPILLLLVLAYLHRAAPLADILTGRVARGLGAVTALGAILLAARAGLEKGLDSIFGRSTHDLHDALARSGPAIQSAHTPDELLYAVTTLAEENLGGQGAAWLRDGSSDALRPAVQASRPLEPASALLSLASDDASVVPTDPLDGHSLFRWLPEWDRQWVVDENLALFAPVRGEGGQMSAALGIRARSNEFPYSRDERLFLQTLATTAALGIERLAGAAPSQERTSAPETGTAGECARCGLVYVRAGEPCSCGNATEACLLPYVLHGKFRLRRRAGRGGMGLVYEADDISLGRVVALKTLPRLSAALSMRLRAEARSMAALTHPHLALIFGAETWRGTPVLVLEYMAGGTLASRLGSPMPLGETIAVIRAVGEALGAMHEAGYLHRDVKPSNIGMNASGDAKLLDFGLAHLLAEARPALRRVDLPAPGDHDQSWSLTATGHVVGTPLYLSPEVLGGAAPGPAQDLWALAVVLYECIAGIHPFRDPQGGRVPQDHACGDVRSLRPECPAGLAEFLDRALARDVGRRPRTAADFNEQLSAHGPRAVIR